MKFLLPLLLMANSAVVTDHPQTYLLSVVSLPLKAGESVERFSISTWGVQFAAVCKIPGGWRIKAGTSATPDGVLEGEGSQGATWFNRSSPLELHALALVTLYGPVQQRDVSNGPDATFKGYAMISTEDGERKTTLTHKNVRLTRAARCP